MADELTAQVADERPQEGHETGQMPPAEPRAAASAQEAEPESAAEAEPPIVRQLRAEAARYRARLRELEAKVRQSEEAQLSEQERLRKRLAELERRELEWQRERQETVLRYEVQLAASRLGIVDPEAAWRLLDLAELEFDEDGRPRNLEQVLRALIKRKPYLVAGSPSGVSVGNGPRGAPAVFTRSQLRDPAFFRAHRDEILRAMAEGRIVEG